MLNDRQLAEGIKAGLIRVEFTAPTGPRQYVVKVSNGSGIKAATVTAGAQTTAVTWACNWAATLGDGWAFHSILPAGA